MRAVYSLLFASLLGFATASAPASYAVWAADSGIARGQGNGLVNGTPTVSYEHGEFQWALRLLYEATGNRSYFEYIKAGADTILSANGKTIGGYKRVGLPIPTLLSLTDNVSSASRNTSWIISVLGQLLCTCKSIFSSPWHRMGRLFREGTTRREMKSIKTVQTF